MHLRLALLTAVLCGASYGCATPADESGAKAPAADAQATAPQPKQSGGYRTGSRLPSYDPDGGSASTGSVSKDDYTDEMRRGINPGQRF
jgi:hypothetical protein